MGISPTNDNFYLDELSDDILENILSLPPSELNDYLNTLIERFFPEASKEQIPTLIKAYKSSFVLERIYRTNPIIYEGFTCLYTRNGLIKEIMNDLYTIKPEKMTVH